MTQETELDYEALDAAMDAADDAYLAEGDDNLAFKKAVLTAIKTYLAAVETELPAVEEHEPDGPDDLHRAANALLNTLWQTAYSGSRSFEENWLEMDRRFPQARWLHNELKSAALVPSTPAESRCEELVKALEPFAKAGQVIDGPFGPALFAEDDMAFQSGCAWTENGERKTITWGDFRRARAAIASFRKRSEADE